MEKQVKTVNERLAELHKNLIEKRIILAEGALTPTLLTQIEEILDILSKSSEKIDIYINSAGGAVGAVISLCRKIQSLKLPVSTICLEEASGAAALLLSCGTKGLRFAIPNAKISVFQNLWIQDTPDSNLELAGKTILSMRNEIISLLCENTGIDKAEAEKMISADRAISPGDAVTYGIIDKIMGN